MKGADVKKDVPTRISRTTNYATRDGIHFYPKRVELLISDSTIVITAAHELHYRIDQQNGSVYTVHLLDEQWDSGPYVTTVKVTILEDGFKINNIQFTKTLGKHEETNQE